jgi:hypothetical protein
MARAYQIRVSCFSTHHCVPLTKFFCLQDPRQDQSDFSYLGLDFDPQSDPLHFGEGGGILASQGDEPLSAEWSQLLQSVSGDLYAALQPADGSAYEGGECKFGSVALA